MHLTNNVSLTTMRTKQPFSMIAIMQSTQESQLMGDESKYYESKKHSCE